MIDKTARSISFFNKKPLIKLDKNDINEMIEFSKENNNCDIRICLHNKAEDELHNMLILERKGSYCRPHLHETKEETLNVILGNLLVIIFDKKGEIINHYYLEENELIRIPKRSFHTVIPLSKISIYHESKCGPFRRSETIYPKWAPEIESNSTDLYVNDIIDSLKD
tara:strand:- start:816 stop:1316 length:501 start_codon:yes stop_codon:yes gene_type:complete